MAVTRVWRIPLSHLPTHHAGAVRRRTPISRRRICCGLHRGFSQWQWRCRSWPPAPPTRSAERVTTTARPSRRPSRRPRPRPSRLPPRHRPRRRPPRRRRRPRLHRPRRRRRRPR
ncbi:hypothetical protein DLJ53_18545 [Acuticoccus sediminis]|uniref:Uncharacterized protein n=1 Tax=Acuticoccus sediminis TaxID=2184697 RepID=A0A8B2NJF4_9HYPH|nr:hypothetical protein DLJ53_18545 [Acuticoccus sediminis]